MDTIKNKYYLEALDCYPYDLPQCMESLGYALSYDPEDADALCLLGRVYAEILKNYEKAKIYFEESMQSDLTNINTPQYYISCLISNEDLDEAQKLIRYALKIKGIDKAVILYYQSVLFEKEKNFKKALEITKEAKMFSFNQKMTDFLTEREKFIKSKMPKKKASKKKKETQ